MSREPGRGSLTSTARPIPLRPPGPGRVGPAIPAMTLARLSLVLSALVFGGFGAWLLVDPQALSALGIVLTTPSARTEIRGFYGGLELGLAGFFALAALRPAWFRPALVVQVCALGGVAAGRLVGFALDGRPDALLLALLAAEIAGTGLGLIALRRLRVGAAPSAGN